LAFEFAFLQVPWIHHGTWNRPSWSLSADWHAYIAFSRDKREKG
jgi:hypothetical protein